MDIKSLLLLLFNGLFLNIVSLLVPIGIVIFILFYFVFGSLKYKNRNAQKEEKNKKNPEKETLPKTSETKITQLEGSIKLEKASEENFTHKKSTEDKKEKPKVTINFQKVEDPQEEERRKKKNELINMINFILDKYGKKEDFYTLPEYIRTLNPDEFKAYAKENFKKN